MALTADLHCPSGASFRVKALTGASIDRLVEYSSDRNKKMRTEAGYMYLLLREAVSEVLNTGPYSSKVVREGTDGLLSPSGLLLGDITYILAYTRVITVGPEMQFEHHCPSCRHRNTPVADLSNLQGQRYSEAAIAAFERGEPVPCTVDGVTVELIPATGATLEYQARVGKDVTNTKGFSLVQASMIAAVPGLQFPDNKAAIADWVKSLDFLALNDLQEAIATLDGGIEMTLHITCESCQHESEALVPLIRPLEAKEAARPRNQAYLRSLKASSTSPAFSAFPQT